MNTAYLSSNDWERFEREHKAAFMMLLTASLKNELHHLGTKDRRLMNDWEKERLVELIGWAVSVGITNTAA